MPRTLYTFDGLDDLYQTAEDLPDVSRHEIYAHHHDEDEWLKLPYRSSLWIEDGGAVGDVSASTDFYNVAQYGDILTAVGTALEPYADTVTPSGHVRLSESGHKATAYIDFDGLAVEPEAGDVIDLGLQVRAAHTGFHGLKYDVGALRQVCSNGMMAFVSDLHYEQTHRDPLDYGLAHQSVTALMDGVDVVEERLTTATDHSFLGEDEALLVLLDQGMDLYFDDPVQTLRESLQEELTPGEDQPTLYDTYNAATRAITHGGLDAGRREAALETAANLLDRQGDLPDPTELGQQALEHRVETYTTDEEVDPYWPNEEETLHSLIHAHGDGG